MRNTKVSCGIQEHTVGINAQSKRQAAKIGAFSLSDVILVFVCIKASGYAFIQRYIPNVIVKVVCYPPFSRNVIMIMPYRNLLRAAHCLKVISWVFVFPNLFS